jgi:UDP-glucose 4-epimerase
VGDHEARRVLITGIAGTLAGRLALRLEDDERIGYLAGVDLDVPAHDLHRTEFIRADLRSPLVAGVGESTRVDTIVHLAVTASPQRAGGRGRMKELNVIGSMQLLAAAQKAPRLRRLILKSTTAVYGSAHDAPSLLREDAETEPRAPHGYTKDVIEVEGYARAFGRRRADATLTMLRFANVVGPTVASPLTRYFELPVVPTVLGYDPRLQFCHEDDAVAFLHRSVLGEHPGIYNIAGRGVLYLSQAIRLAGKPTAPVPLPVVNGAATLVGRIGSLDFSPEQLQFLLYGRVGDISRMRAAFGADAAYTTRTAFEDFVARRVRGPITKARVEAVERTVRDVALRAGAAAVKRMPAAGRPAVREGG